MKGIARSGVLLLATIAGLAATQAQAVLRDDTGIEAIGVVDLDGRLRPSPPLSADTQTETEPPYTRSVVTVADSGATFEYFAQADIGNQTLKALGMLENAGTTDLVGDGLAILQVSAQIRDTLTLHSALPGKQLVTLEMAIDGELDFAPGIPLLPRVNASMFFGPVGGIQGSDLNTYSVPGAIDDVLSVTIEVEGDTDVYLDTFLGFSVFYARPGDVISGRLDNTARLTLNLPPGVSLAGSTSGTFGEIIAPVPLPGALPMLLSALLLPVLRRRAVR
ncbi:MAG: hypothetical protein AB7Q97_11730 [Gammaproteobacteria bacterium]